MVLFPNLDGTVKKTQRIGNSLGGGPPLQSTVIVLSEVLWRLSATSTETECRTCCRIVDPGRFGHFDGSGYRFDLHASFEIRRNRQAVLSGRERTQWRSFSREPRSIRSSMVAAGDVDGDGVGELLVGAPGSDIGSFFSNADLGAVNILYMKSDITAPTLQSIQRYVPAQSPTTSNSVSFRVTFSEEVLNFDGSDLIVTGSSQATIQGISQSPPFRTSSA